MREYAAPLFWSFAAALNVAAAARTSRAGWLDSRTPDQQRAVRDSLSSQWATAMLVAVVGYCAFAATWAALRGQPTWWLWTVAAGGHPAALALRRRTATRLRGGAPAPQVPAAQRRRGRRLTVLLGSQRGHGGTLLKRRRPSVEAQRGP